MTKIEFTVIGKPQTAGSKRSFPYKKTSGNLGVRVTDDNERSKSWQQAVRHASRDAYDGPLLSGALRVAITFFRPRPNGHYGTGKNAGILKQSAPEYPTTRPDVLKLARCVEDALTGVIWRDDAQIVSEPLGKEFGEPARCELVIEIL
jgi:Holliday junction resolvase RusA-like endonuclease